MINLSSLTTETQNQNTLDLDSMTALQIVSVMNKEDARVPTAISAALPEIAEAAECASSAINCGGRIIYIGAGTSGRLGMLDAAECEPTFGISPDKVVALMAGGKDAFVKAIEGAEDNEKAGIDDLKSIQLMPKDCVIGIAASGRTPYVIGALEYANSIGSPTIAISCNENSAISSIAKIAIEVVVGPEVLTGSTRLKSGSAQKMILNMISTTAMVLCGRVYKNLMVDVKKTNAKLNARAINIIIQATGVNENTAKEALEQAEGNTKVAITSILLGMPADKAKYYLDRSEGHVRDALRIALEERSLCEQAV